jgi:arylamine N-acetyltransferase
VGFSVEHHRYLRLLGFEAAPSGLAGLQQLVLTHVCRVPFENVSKLLLYAREKRGRVTTLSEYLDGIEEHDLGGTCYSANPYFFELLRALRYDADLLGASMATPNVHTCIRVHLEGRAYHVDVGYGAPFRAPIPLDELPLEIADGAERYVLNRSEDNGELTVGVYAGRDRLHGYRVHDTPREFEFFQQTVCDSFLPGKTFMSWLRIARFFESGSVHLHNHLLTINRRNETTTKELTNLGELRDVIRGVFAMPRCPIAEAVAVLEEVTGQPFFARR